MPGDNMVGDYTTAELVAMPQNVLDAVAAAGFRKPKDPADVANQRPAFAGVSVGSGAQIQVEPTLTSFGAQTAPVQSGGGWKRKGSKPGYDFTAPSGEKCRLRTLQIEELLLEGLLDQVTRLDGLAQELVNISTGLPPEQQKLPSREDLAALLTVLNKITVMAVVEPRVVADGAPDATDDDVFVSDIDLGDRVAIVDEALKGIKALDNFRQS